MNISKIANNIKESNKSEFPPVHLWNPEICEGQEISINREGDWFYNNSLIKNHKLVKLFSTVLKNDNNQYYLVTPHEKVPVYVDIAPYLITDFTIEKDLIKLHTNTDYSFYLNDKNSMELQKYDDTFIPIVNVRSNIKGFFSRSIYYNLIELALKDNVIIDNILYINSDNKNHPLGRIA